MFKYIHRNPHITATLVLGICSFFIIAPPFSGYFNADTAVPILQTADFSLPEDLYYWGQARLGSFIPLVSQPFFYLFGNPLWTFSIIHYLFLFLTVFIYSTFLKNNFLKIALAIVIFFPLIYFRFITLPGHPYGPQLFCIAVIHYLLGIELKKNWKEPIALLTTLRIFSIGTCSIIALWLSEYSLIFLTFLFADFIVQKIKQEKPRTKELTQKIILPLLVTFLLGAIFIIYAKINAQGNAYGGLPLWMPFEDIFRVIQVYGTATIKKFFLNSENVIQSILFISITGIALVGLKKAIQYAPQFLALMMLSIFPAILLYWVGINGWPGRFFTPAYLFFWLTVFKTLDNFQWKKNQFIGLFFIIAILQAAPIIHFEFNTPSEINRLNVFSKLGNCGIVGDYWSSYNIAVANYPIITATPNEYTCRNFGYANRAIQHKNLYLIKNNWLEQFPNTITIFDQVFVKSDSTSIQLEEFILAKYQKQD